MKPSVKPALVGNFTQLMCVFHALDSIVLWKTFHSRSVCEPDWPWSVEENPQQSSPPGLNCSCSLAEAVWVCVTLGSCLH